MKKFNLTSIFISTFIVLSALLTGFVSPEIEETKETTTTPGEVTFSVRTVTENGNYAPKHVLAIWVEDANDFVKTRLAMAGVRKIYLYKWKAASNYNVVDAITGPTLNSHQSHTITWDCTDLDGVEVPDGEYTIYVEFTEKHAQGPWTTINFTKGPEAQHLIIPNEPYFKDMVLDFVPEIVPVTQTITLNEGFQFVSTNVEPNDSDMNVVLSEILNDNLEYVRNSDGSMFRKIGPNWVNGIGEWVTIEGYLFKMNGPEQLIIEGYRIDPHTPINLYSGFQFVSYLPQNQMDALTAFDGILSDNLLYVRDSNGGMLRKIGPNWVNGIGVCSEGQGYLIKMSSDDVLIYP